MKIETREIYKCDYCNKLYQRKHACERHEMSCKSNPDYLRACHTCRFVKKVNATIWAGDERGEREVGVLFCDKIDSYIYPPSVAAKGNAFDMGDKFNIEMPRECEFHKETDYMNFDEFIETL